MRGGILLNAFQIFVKDDILIDAPQNFVRDMKQQIEFVLPPTIMAITAQLAFHRSSTPIGSPTALVRDGDIEIDDNSC